MSVTLKLTFPAGRYHATPWGRHVNEGVPEWPPSPWRLLRALVATWRRKCPELPEAVVRPVLEALARPPLFRLPPARAAHTRHYVPWEKKGPADRTLVFDTFVLVGRQAPLLIGWPDADLTPDDRDVLGRLVANLTSLGRAEGWVHAELADDAAVQWNCVPAAAAAGELVPVFCADPATAFGSEHYPAPDATKLRRGLAPADRLFDCPRWHLCLDTETIHDRKWPRVPGAVWVAYDRPADALTAMPNGEAAPPTERSGPVVARLLLDGPVLPRVTETVAVAEAVRRALLRRFKAVIRRGDRSIPADAHPRDFPQLRSRTLSGKEGGRRITGAHGHAYYLPTDEDGDGRIDHVTVFARAGFTADERTALAGLRVIERGEAAELHARLVGLGEPAELRAPLLGPARAWVSATPFVGPAHVGRCGRPRYLRKALRRELRRAVERGELPAGAALLAVAPAAGPDADRLAPVRPRDFRRARARPGDDGWGRPFGLFRVCFDRPVAGPLCLGYAAHFGLGLFLPAAP